MVGLLLLLAAATILRDRRQRRGAPGGPKLVLEPAVSGPAPTTDTTGRAAIEGQSESLAETPPSSGVSAPPTRPDGMTGGRGAAEDSFDVAVRLHHDGRRREAASAYERAERSGDEDAAFNLGVLHYEAGEYDAAEAAWRRCIAREHAEAATNLGFLRQRRGDRAGARDLYMKAARWGDEMATRMLAELSASGPNLPSASAEPGPNSTGSSEQTPSTTARSRVQS